MKQENLTPEQKAYHDRFVNDLIWYAKRNLKTVDKSPEKGLVNMELNSAQLYLHDKAEAMLREVGYVRIIVIKGRQQGISTYITARFYWKATMMTAISVFIMAHESEATQTLFEKVQMYWQESHPSLAPKLETENMKRWQFENKSKYAVGTANSENTGRGKTVSHLHLSEGAYFKNPRAIKAGLLKTVAPTPKTEVFVETTGNGKNWVYELVQKSLKGLTRFRVVFIPWYIQKEYRAPVPADFVRTEEEQKLMDMYHTYDGMPGLVDDEQLQWRRLEIAELEYEWLFKQEYPNTLQEAFQTSEDSMYDSAAVEAAMHRDVAAVGPLVLGVDPARTGGDETVLTWRRGRKVLRQKAYPRMESETKLAGIIAEELGKTGNDYVDMVFIDYAHGYGVVDILHNAGHRKRVRGVHFGEGASKDIYANIRTEMAFRFKHWLEDPLCSLPDSPELAIDIDSIPMPALGGNGKWQVISKEKIREDLHMSPDRLDSLWLTFAFPVAVESKLGHNDNAQRESVSVHLERQKSIGRHHRGSDHRRRFK